MIATTTTTLLLERLTDPAAQDAWRELDGRYRPILFGLARRVGLDESDAADAAQETLVRFAAAYRDGRYVRERGRLRSWMLGIARNVLADMRAERRRRDAWRGGSAIGQLPGAVELEGIWSDERRAAIVRRAMEAIRAGTRASERTVRAFELVVFHGRAPQAVADELGMSRHDVYVAKHRIAEKLRAMVIRIESLYDEEP